MGEVGYVAQTAKFLKQLQYIVIAVVDEKGSPWAVPVRVQKLEDGVIEWDSHTKSRHSLAIARNPWIALTAFASHGDDWNEIGVYAEAEVKEIMPVHDEFARYRARITAVWYNDADHVKCEVELDKLIGLLT